jgi:tRNA (guanine-N7-)-methyltransferase
VAHSNNKFIRSIRSFVRRESRITPAQVRALGELWPRYGIPEGTAALDWPSVFGRRAPVILEIGFGNGEALRPGAGSLLRRIEVGTLSNVRVMLGDASEILAQRIPDASLAAVHLFFPDPWPKKRHRKRRLVQPEFAALVARKLQAGGYFHLATDWPAYAEHMAAVLSRTEGLVDAGGEGRFQRLVEGRLSTRFEQRGRRLGHEVRDLVYLRRV